MRRTEVSAGGVVYRKKGKKIEFLLLKDKNNNWTFPKGLIEDREEEKVAAQREVAEEVGLHEIILVRELPRITYWYKWQDDLIKKTVYYFLFKAVRKERPKPQKEEGISQVKWFDPQKAVEIVGYRKTNEPVLNEVFKILNP